LIVSVLVARMSEAIMRGVTGDMNDKNRMGPGISLCPASYIDGASSRGN
jgi:hypothetical protein